MQKSGSTPPTESENQPTSLANTVAEYSFEGDGFWMVVKEVVAPMLTFRADLDLILGNLDDLGAGPQDFELCFTWDGLDNWLCNEAAEIKEKELACATVTPYEEDNFPQPQKGIEPPNRPPPELIQAPINVEGPLELLLDRAPQHTTWLKSQVPAWALGGNKALEEVHGYPLNLLNPYFEAPIKEEPDIAMLKA